ncbi:glutamate receptor ionotropic, kainate 2 isoform X2 [Eurytemora carolleeae]|uniref:glutamate receptor ionotropic, kainate 2 isoform X2 n=1 Tax=Eurytemora carolleeae TaxID=1294199 RepID=UPI000C785B6C|nr:glutamate receptor ionotropic, kainate 2 isoform X2 [Eurytemora carolleeae]|eukprot:XP_023321584.1 glutamate receptor ionotropic, kainate 2-like isoform X2 [Eurytemora affinis]
MIRYGWTKVTLLYDTNLNLKLLQPILQHTAAASSGFIINLKQLKPEEDEDYRGVLKEIVANEGENIVLSCDLEILFTVLNQAQQIGIVTGKQNWILTNLDAHTADLSPFKYDYTNFTLFRLIDPGNPFVYRILGEIVEEEIRMGRSLDFVDFSGGLKLDAALIYDGVHLLAAALGQLSNVQELQLQSLSCEDSSTQFWKHGSSIVNYMRATILPGITGPIRFDSYGQRTDFQLEVLQLLEEHGVVKVGNWVEGDGFNITGYHLESKPEPSTINPMFNKSLTVTTIFNDPYTMLKEDTKLLVGNERYEGFIPDMVHILSTILQFNYTLRIVEDGQYGSYDANTGRWNGMIGEVLTGEADMVVADLSITTSRAAAVEFSMPWMNLGISIIYQKPKKAAPSLLSFMLPFSDGVWIAMLAAFILVAFLTFFIGRFSPNEWFNPNFCILEPKEVETQWTFCNSVWHTVGALMQQGTEFCPVALSTRFLVGVFYFFTLIIVSSYTANLAASLTAEMLERPIENAEDLAKQTEIKYGVVYCGSTCNFFKTSTFNTYSTMWKFMSDNKDEVMVGSNKEGVEKVEAGGYAFMMEDAGIQYIVERRCSLAQIGGNLDTKGYGIATRPGSGFKDLLDSAILKMQENGDFHKLKNKWWKQKRGGGQCLQSASASVTKLDLANLGGIFLVTLLGCGLAGLVCILELIWGCYQDSQEFGTPWGFEIKQRIEFAYRCSSFGRKGRMASMRYKNESRIFLHDHLITI